MVAGPNGFPSSNTIQTSQRMHLSLSNCSSEAPEAPEAKPPVKKRKVGTAALVEQNGDNADQNGDNAEQDGDSAEEDADDAKEEEDESNDEPEKPVDAGISAKKINGATAPDAHKEEVIHDEGK